MGREEDSKISPPKENETPLHAGTHEAPNHILAFFIQALSLHFPYFLYKSIQGPHHLRLLHVVNRRGQQYYHHINIEGIAAFY